jgi:hypothetical protein
VFDTYGAQKMVPYDEAWNKILESLYTIQSFDKINEDGKYDDYSLMGMV